MRLLVQAALLIGILLSASVQAQGIFVLAIDRDPAPDGNGQLGPASIFALSEGVVAFTSTTTGSAHGGSDNEILAVADWSGVDVVFREGDPAPGNGSFAGAAGMISTNPFGEVAFQGYLTGTSLGSTNDEGIFRGSASSVVQIVRENQPEPAGGPGLFNSFGTPTINWFGQVAFWAAIRNTGTPLSSTHGIFIGDGTTLLQVARTYTAAPNGIGQFRNISSSPVISNYGVVAFRADLSGTAGGTIDDSGIFMGNGLLTVTVARENDLSPDGNGRLDQLNFPWMNDNVVTAFYATLRNTAGGGSDNHAIFEGAGGTLVKVVRTGDPAPDADGVFDALDNTLSINSEGDVAFLASLRNASAGRGQGVFWGNGLTLTTIARSGDISPDGRKFTSFSGAAINGTRTVAFQSNVGLYLSDGTETITIARIGDKLDGGTITQLGFDPKTFDDFHELAFQAVLKDGRMGVFLFSPLIKWRQNGDGSWSNENYWTVSLRPSEYVQVEIDPAEGGVVEGPEEDTTIRSLEVGGDTEGTAELNLQPEGEITVMEGASIEAGGKLSGEGAIVGDVDNNGTVSPGNSPGHIEVDGDYAQSANGTLVLQLGGQDAALYDQLLVSGAVRLSGTLKIELVDDFVPAAGMTFDVVTGTSITLTNLSVMASTLPDGLGLKRAIVDVSGGKALRFSVAAMLSAPSLLAPLDHATVQDDTPFFDWTDVDATTYRLIVARNAADLPSDPAEDGGGASVVINQTTTTPGYASTTPLAAGATYYWKVAGRTNTQQGAWSAANMFTIAAFATQPSSRTVAAGDSVAFTVVANGTPAPAYRWQLSTNGGSSWSNVSTSRPYSGATSATLTISSVTTAMNGYQFRCVTTRNGVAANSNAATLTVSIRPAFTTQPSSRTITSGGNTTFTAAANGTPVPTYQWQISTNGGSSWTDAANSGVYAGVASGTLAITGATAEMNGYRYRCVATNDVGNASSNAATLTVTVAPSFTTQPVGRTVAVGENVNFVAAANGTPAPSYKWQLSTNSGGSWSDIANKRPYSGATSGTLVLSGATAAMNGYQYRCIATNSGASVTSNAVTLTVKIAPSFTAQPANRTVAAGATTSFVAVANGGPAPTYQWQVSTNGGSSWSDVVNGSPYSGAATGTLTITGATSEMTGYRYRCVATNELRSVTSNTATLTVNVAPGFSAQPENQHVATGTAARFAVVASGTPIPGYQWQLSTNGGSSWSNVSNRSPYSGATTATLTISKATNAMAGYRYRCVLTNNVGTATSDSATLTVFVPPNFTTQPANKTIAAAGNTSFTAVATGTLAVTYQWQVSTNGGNTWSDVVNESPYSGVTTGQLTVAGATAEMNGYRYRCVATDSVGNATSNVATLTVNFGPAFSTQPTGQTIATRGTVTFVAAATGSPSPAYQWQVSTNGGGTWSNVANRSPYSGATSGALKITRVTATMNGYRYRCLASNSVQSNVASDAVALTVAP